MLVFRRVVEPGACHIAAGRDLHPRQQEFLVAAHDAVAAATDPAEHRQADSRFHLAIAAVTESELTIRSVTAVQSDLHDMLSAIPVLDVNIDHSSRQHRTILPAILKGEADQGPPGHGEPLRRHRRPAPRPPDMTAHDQPGDRMSLPARNPRLMSLPTSRT